MKAPIKLNYLAAAGICASREEVRYYLNGVLAEITEGGTRFVATDGHRLIALLDDTDAEGDHKAVKARAIIPLALCKPKVKRVTLFSRNKSKDPNAGWLEINDTTVRVEADGITYEAQGIDGTYPDWTAVVPAEVNGEPGTFNGKYLADFTRINKMLTGDIYLPHISHNGRGPAIVHFNSAVRGFGVLMPIRNEPPNWVVPDWAPISKKKKKAA